MIMTKDTPFLTAALEEIAKSIPIFPCGVGKKTPLTPHGFQDATVDEDTIRQWAAKWPNANLAIPTGARSGMIVLDVDMGEEKDGEAALSKLIATYGALPATLEVKTPRGGRHLYFKYPGQRVPTRTNYPAPALDVRGDGGYVLIPNSRTERGAYTWTNRMAPAECPPWLLALLLNGSAPVEKTRAITSSPTSDRYTKTIDEEDRIRDALRFIPAADYDIWTRVGMAIHSEMPDGRGLAIWDEWSRSCPDKYGEQQTSKKWTSFKMNRPGGVTLGTLFEYAKRGGWTTSVAGRMPALEPARRDDLLIMPSGEVTITSTAIDLFRRISPTQELFFRGGAVMRLCEGEVGVLQLDTIHPATFRSTIEKYGRPMAWRSGRGGKSVLQPVVVSLDMADALLQSDLARDHLPMVRGIVNCPIIVRTGQDSVILEKGHHEQNGGILVTGGNHPQPMSICEAKTCLAELLEDFDFATPGDRSRAIAAFITPALRLGCWIQGHIPADVAESDLSQSGKGYRHKLVAAIYRDKLRIISQKNGGVGGIDESVAQALVAGSPFVSLDNLRGRLNSQWIEALLTAGGPVPCRIPHRGEIMCDSRHFILMITSNGVETTRDLANRSSIVRICKKPDGYPFRSYHEGDLLSHVQANQPRYLGAIFSIIAEWSSAGCPILPCLKHDFREWAGSLGWIVENILGETPLLVGHVETQIRVSNPALSFVRQVAIAIAQDGALDQTKHANEIAEICDQYGLEIPGCRSEDDAKRAMTIGRILKCAFGKTEQIHVEGYIISRKTTFKYYAKSQENKETKEYVFSCETPQPEEPEQ